MRPRASIKPDGEPEKDKKNSDLVLILNNLQLQSQPHFTTLQEALGELRGSVAQVSIYAKSLEMAEDKARYTAAKGSGADYAVVGDKTVAIPVNTVLRRQYDVTKIRYDQALNDAKRLAYMARLSIEQRLGVRLNTITTKVGSLEPPSAWADDVCTLQGIDYKKFREAKPIGSADAGLTGSEKELLEEFADQYVGDYIAKLENFVAFYGIEHPSREGDDTAVLSMREHLLRSGVSCQRPTANELYYSDRLASFDMVSSGTTAIRRGWQVNACQPGDDRCLRVTESGSLAERETPEGAGGSVNWLHEDATASGDAGVPPAPDSGTLEAGGVDGATYGGDADAPKFTPGGTTSQDVTLVSGAKYILSWWDQARTSTGALATGSGVPYRVTVYDGDWRPIQSQENTPGAVWSVRQRLEFTAAGTNHHVVFRASTGSGPLGSVAIANAQLELTTKTGGAPTAYISVASTRTHITTLCGQASAQDFQKSFEHRCDTFGKCWYELARPFRLDTTNLVIGPNALGGKVAGGNFNYRHGTVALNFVGTGVRDCTYEPGASCYGAGYFEYTLAHDAYETSVLGWDGESECFNFGMAALNRAKALAAERYVTLPFGSADASFLSQPHVEKREFRGRPLDGSYTLKIWDTPGLAWNRMEDIQIILKYRYWSAIKTATE